MFAVSTVLAAEGSIVDLDITVVFQLAIFLILFLLLRPILFQRMVALLAAREKGIEGARVDSHKMEEESRAKTEAYEKAIEKVRAEAAVERDHLRDEGARAAAVLLGNARKQTTTQLAEGKARIQAEGDALRLELRPRVQELAHDLAKKILGRDPGGAA